MVAGRQRHLPTPKRVLMIYSVTGRGGDAVQVQCMSDALRRLGCEVALVGARPLRPYSFSGLDGKARSWAKKSPWWTKDLLILGLHCLAGLKGALVAFRFRPDCIIERTTPYGLIGLWLARLFRLPLIAHLDAPYGEERAYRKEHLCTLLHRHTMRALGRRATLVVLGSEASRAYYAKLGIPANKTVLMRNGVFPEDIAPAPARANGKLVLGYVGSMAVWHRVHLLIEAASRLREQGFPVKVKIVGMGEDYQNLLAFARSRNMSKVVEFTGPLNHRQALEAIDDFSVGVLPHTLSCGAPMKLVEYAARGVPMVAPDLPNLRQMWGNASVGYFRPGDVEALERTLRSLIENPDERDRLATSAWKLVRQRYTWLHQMGSVFEALSGESPEEATNSILRKEARSADRAGMPAEAGASAAETHLSLGAGRGWG
ncbi:MAG: glycosyltransferase [Bacillota bacterium]|nr:MAG: glycosyltransferase [Bacillota bacterium]